MSTTFMTITNDDLLKACPFGTTQLPTNWGDLMDLQDKVERGEFTNLDFLESLKVQSIQEQPETPKKRKKKRAKKDNWEKVKSESKKRTKVASPHSPINNNLPCAENMVKKNTQKQNQKNTTIVLKNLPYWDTYIIDMLVQFEKYGEIEYVNVLRNTNKSCKGIAFLRFKDSRAAELALDNGNYWQDDRMIKVEPVQ